MNFHMTSAYHPHSTPNLATVNIGKDQAADVFFDREHMVVESYMASGYITHRDKIPLSELSNLLRLYHHLKKAGTDTVYISTRGTDHALVFETFKIIDTPKETEDVA